MAFPPKEDEVIEVEVEVDVDEVERIERVPSVAASAPGKINRTLESLGEIYKQKFPERDCRWVYSPEHRRELSNVIARNAEGYRRVMVRDLGVDLEGLENDDVVRVGDVILMGISREEREELAVDKQQLADEQVRTVEREYYETSEEMFDETRTQSDESSGAPRGRSKTQIRTHEYDAEQRTSE